MRSDVVDSHILVMTVDRVAKKNAFTPKITNELADALTRLDEDPELFVGVLSFAGEHTTAGLGDAVVLHRRGPRGGRAAQA